MTQQAKRERYLRELTSLPTAAGREDRVVEWVEAWAKRRPQVQVKRDRYGNLLLKRPAARSKRPIVLAAHMDHPAFVVTGVREPDMVEADFRGGVADAYFVDTAVHLHRAGRRVQRGAIIQLYPPTRPGLDKRVVVRFDEPVTAEAGDVMTWAIAPARIAGGRLRAPACDDLAGVAAALAAFEALSRPRKKRLGRDIRVLLTRAEEVGFVGAIGACGSGIMPRGSRIVALENSKSFEDSPIGGGPIVRVGDRTSTFDPDLTYRVGKIAEAIAAADPSFRWQRRLMPGGTCEASAYQALGYTATCVCLPLGNYHNMNEKAQRIDAEMIALADYHGLIRLLVEVGRCLDDPERSPGLGGRLRDIFAQRRGLLEPGATKPRR